MFNRIPFDIKTGPSHFQRALQSLFEDLSYVDTFMDDIVVHSRSVKEHHKHLENVISILNESIGAPWLNQATSIKFCVILRVRISKRNNLAKAFLSVRLNKFHDQTRNWPTPNFTKTALGKMKRPEGLTVRRSIREFVASNLQIRE